MIIQVNDMNQSLVFRKLSFLTIGLLCTFLLISIVPILASMPCSASQIGIAETIVNKVYLDSLLSGVKRGQKLYQGQKIRTSMNSSAELLLSDKTFLYLGERSDIKLTRFFLGKGNSNDINQLELVRGLLRFASAGIKKNNFSIRTQNASVGVRGTNFDIMFNKHGTEVSVNRGTIDVTTPSGSIMVKAGQVYRVPLAGVQKLSLSISPAMKRAIGKLKKQIKPKSELAAIDKQEKGVKVQSSDAKNKLYMDLSLGRVVIRMLPKIAPNHVKRISELVKKKFYDGLIFHNVVPGFVAETGDPSGTGVGGTGETLLAELSNTPFVRGLVGMKRDRNDLNSGDSQFFILLGEAKHLQGKYTVWGKIEEGMMLLDRLRTGSPPASPNKIIKMRLGNDPN
jgi:peptidylprolyl isomerase